jgi:alkylated DNA nucleotide flippase Atl1
MKKSWRETLADDKGLPKVCESRAGRGIRSGEGRMVIAAPREVNALIKQVPKGRVTIINELRGTPARRCRVDVAWPITTGIFSGIAAHAAAENEAEGKKRIMPFWGILKRDGGINPKYPGGARLIARRLRAEGHKIVSKGKWLLVADYERKLFTKLR